VNTDLPVPVVRRVVRALAVTPAALLLLAAGPALASPPATWQDNPPVSGFHVLWLLVGIPLGLFLLITFLVYLPSLIHHDHTSRTAGHDAEWFGGSSTGTVPSAGTMVGGPDTDAGRGGSSGRW
jgi:hypothetical protein